MPLTGVPSAINKAVRATVINHPLTSNCSIVRKKVNRVGGPVVGGLPTLGGLGVLNSEDESDIEWEPLGNGYMLPADPFSPSQMMDRQDANNGSIPELRFLIEPENEGEFALKKYDVCFQIIGNVRLAFEIVSVETTSNVPPFTERYVCNRRDDMHYTV